MNKGSIHAPGQFFKKQDLVVQKYGGATLAGPEKIKQVALRIAGLSKAGKKVIVVVSAMGKSTNELIALASQISQNPNRRELDMLLSTGERVSMALLSMALNELSCKAISFTGSQAGILTTDSHLSTYIIDVKSPRVHQALEEGKIVVLAGFQGVSAKRKEITTLGRGGSDITAITMASAMGASRCEILKDVAGVFTADPKIVPNAKTVLHLTHRQLMEMTFWGAQFLHYRSTELAFRNNINLLINSANSTPELDSGTYIQQKTHKDNMFETNEVLSINSHDFVLKVQSLRRNLNQTFRELTNQLEKTEIALPQVLFSQQGEQGTDLYLSGPLEVLTAIQRELPSAHLNPSKQGFSIVKKEFCAVAVTCTGSYNIEMSQKITQALEENGVFIHDLLLSPMSLVSIIDRNQKNRAVEILHSLISSTQ